MKGVTMSLSKNITALRKQRGLTQKQLAEAIGVSQESIYEWENGLETTTSADLKNLEAALNCPSGTLSDFIATTGSVTPSVAPPACKVDFALEQHLHEGEKVIWNGKQGDNSRTIVGKAFLFTLVASASLVDYLTESRDFWRSGWFVIALLGAAWTCLNAIKLLKITTKPGTLFALTSSRIIIVAFEPRGNVFDLSIEDIQDLRLSGQLKKRGTIDFNPPKTPFGQTFRMAFVDIDDAKHVMALINEQRNLKKQKQS